MTQSPVGEDELNWKVAEYWAADGWWNWGAPSNKLNATSLVKLASTVLGAEESDLDRMGWLDTRGARFIVKEAYRVAMRWEEDNRWKEWRMIWKMKVQQRIKVFAWILFHRRLLTNRERWRRRMTDSPLCVRCNENDEEVLHAIRDCPIAREVWVWLILLELVDDFFKLGFKEWVVWLVRRVKRGVDCNDCQRWCSSYASCSGDGGTWRFLKELGWSCNKDSSWSWSGLRIATLSWRRKSFRSWA